MRGKWDRKKKEVGEQGGGREGGESKEVKSKGEGAREWRRGESDYFIIKPSLTWAAATTQTLLRPSLSGSACVCVGIHSLLPVHPCIRSDMGGILVPTYVQVRVCVCVWRLCELQCDRDGCNTHVSLPTRWQGRAPSEGQTLSSNDRPALNVCVCMRACVHHVRTACVAERESLDKFCFSLFIFSHKWQALCINRRPICMRVCTSLLCPRTCMCVLPSVWWGVYMINTRQAWEEFWSGALQQLLWKQH